MGASGLLSAGRIQNVSISTGVTSLSQEFAHRRAQSLPILLVHHAETCAAAEHVSDASRMLMGDCMPQLAPADGNHITERVSVIVRPARNQLLCCKPMAAQEMVDLLRALRCVGQQ